MHKLNWSQSRELFRGRLVERYDDTEAKSYDAYVGTLAKEDEDAYLADIQEANPIVATKP